MRRALLLVSALAALGGCAGSEWVRDGASETQLTQDRGECERRAAAGPGGTRPGLGVARPDLSATGDVASGVDLRLGMRATTARSDLFERCMAERGWRRR